MAAPANSDAGFQLRLLAGEPADRFAAALPLSGDALVSTVGCTMEAGEPAAAAGEGSVWLHWQSATRQVVAIQHGVRQALGHWHGSNSRMEVFTGASLGSLVPVCAPVRPNSAVFVAEAGRIYHIRVLAMAETDGVAEVTASTRPLGGGLEEWLMEAGALRAMTGAGHDGQALALVNQAQALAPDAPRVRLAAAFLELRLAASTPAGRILAARVIPNTSDTLPVVFASEADAGPDGAIPADLSLDGFLEDAPEPGACSWVWNEE